MNAALVLLPIALMIFVGWFSVKIGYIDLKTERYLTRFIFNICVPSLIIKNLLTLNIHLDHNLLLYWAGYFIPLAVSWAFATLIFAKVFKRRTVNKVLYSMAANQSNMVIIGIPVVSYALGDKGLSALFLMISIHMPILFGASVILLSRDPNAAGNLVKSLLSLFKNPIIVAMLLGLFLSGIGFQCPRPLFVVLDQFSHIVAPAALFGIGMTMCGQSVTRDLKTALVIVAFKLVVLPSLVFVTVYYVLHLPSLYASTAVLLAALPCGVNSYILARKYEADVFPVSSALTVSIVASGATLLFWMHLVAG